MKNENKLDTAAIESLYAERQELARWVTPPKPDPAVWPPEGWAVHPTDPTKLYKVIDAEQLRAELFGSPARTEWLKESRGRIAQIDKILVAHFFPKKKDEGTQRKTLGGFITMCKTGLKRTVDTEAVQVITEKFPELEDALTWKAEIDLKAYRELDEELQEALDQAIEVKPEKEVFEIARKPAKK